DVGPRQVVDGDIVGTAERDEVHPFGAVHVHGDAAHVAGESQSRAIGREVYLLIDIRTVELQCIRAVLTLDNVAAFTRVPDEGVVAGAQEGYVVAAAAVDEVIAVAAEQLVVA